jgi:hypothetical protein
MQLQLKIIRQFASVFVCVSNLLQHSQENWKRATVHDQSAHARTGLAEGYFEPLV